jgi:hypothetical protein
MTQLTRVAKLNLPSSAESDGRYWARTRLPHSGHRWTGVVTADESRSGTGVATGQHRTSADTPDTHSERSCGRNVDEMKRRVAPSVLPFLLETSPADLRDDSASRGVLSLPPTRPVTTSAPSGILFTCRGRTHQSADPPPAIAALRALQVRPEDLAAAGLEIGMWPI